MIIMMCVCPMDPLIVTSRQQGKEESKRGRSHKGVGFLRLLPDGRDLFLDLGNFFFVTSAVMVGDLCFQFGDLLCVFPVRVAARRTKKKMLANRRSHRQPHRRHTDK